MDTPSSRPIDRVCRVLAAAGVAAALSAASPQPGWSIFGCALATMVLLPVAIVSAALAERARPVVRRLDERGWNPGRLVVIGHLLAVTAAGGVYAANFFLGDSPYGPASRIAYLVSIALAVGLARTAWRSMHDRRFSRLSRFPPRPTATAALAIDAMLAAALDAWGIRAEFHVHDVLLVLTTAALSAAVTLALPPVRARVAALGAVLPLSAAAIILGFVQSPREIDALALRHAPQATALDWIRAATDRDGDGYSPLLGGGDCDDHDPTAFPLSPIHDCLDWRGHADAPAPRTVATPEPSRAPRVILLLSIDTLRCGFGVADAPPLRDGCPVLTRLAAEGWSRVDARTPRPVTADSLGQLVLGPDGRRSMPAALRAQGFRSDVILTFPQALGLPGVRAQFDSVDETLASTRISPPRTDELTAYTAARVQAALATPQQRTLLWAHYPDLHFSYKLDTSIWKHGSVDDYAVVLRRTDAAIGRLLDSLAAAPHADDLLVVIVGDHGEEFGEHGERYHGFTLYDPALRVPIIVWSPHDGRRYGAPEVPRYLPDLGGYIVNAASGAPMSVHDSLLLRTDVREHLVAVVAGGWKLIYDRKRNTRQLFDLRVDPGETVNRAYDHPDVVDRLGRMIGGLLEAAPPFKRCAAARPARARAASRSD